MRSSRPYIVVYVSISVPAVIAGVAASRYGLRYTTYVFGLVVMALAAATTVAISTSRSTQVCGLLGLP